MRPNTADNVKKQQSQQKRNHTTRVKLRRFNDGALVCVKDPLAGDKWFRGVVLSSQGNVSYSVQLESSRIRKCQIDQLRERPVGLPSIPVVVPPEDSYDCTSCLRICQDPFSSSSCVNIGTDRNPFCWGQLRHDGTHRGSQRKSSTEYTDRISEK